MSLDDDDNPASGAAQAAHAGASEAADDALEDGMPDYKLFKTMYEKKGLSGKTIRKGEKDFESHGTRAQDGVLEASRAAMEEVLSYTRVHRGDAWVRGWLFRDWWTGAGDGDDGELRDRVVVVEHERGGWMKDIGRVVSGDKTRPGIGRMWLLPEEALYLVERGTLDLWWPDKEFEELLPKTKASDAHRSAAAGGPDDYDVGLPLSLEAAYSMLIGFEDERGKTSLPKYQVYTHLKRAGFHVLRAPLDAPPPTDDVAKTSPSSPWQWLFSLISWNSTPNESPASGPLVHPGLYRAYRPIYQQLALLPRHKPSPSTSLISPSRTSAPSPSQPSHPFRVQYHVWKAGGAPFSKRNPPPPDFRIAVCDTSDSHLPTLDEIDTLLQSTPWHPPDEKLAGLGRMYQRLKHGYRNVLLAVVDSGLVNFMRFAESSFAEEPIFERFDSKNSARGGKKGGRGGRGRGRGRGGRGRGR